MKRYILTAAALTLIACSRPTEEERTAKLIEQSKVLNAMQAAGAGNPQRYTQETVFVFLSQHNDTAKQIAVLCAPGTDHGPVTEPERIVCGTAAQQRAVHNAFGYAPPTVSGKVW